MGQPPTPPNKVTLARAARAKLDAGSNINATELGALLDISPVTVHAQARSGRYPSQQPTGPGGARRFSPADVDRIRALSASPVPA